MVGVSRRIGFLTDDLLRSYQRSVHLALELAAAEHGCSLTAIVGRELHHPERGERAQNALFEWLSPQALDGLIVLSGVLVNYTGTPGLQALLTRLHPLPAVSIGVDLSPIPSVLVDNRVGMRKAVQHLIQSHGCRSLVYIGGPKENPEAEERFSGYRDALQAAGLDHSEQLCAYGQFDLSSGKSCMKAVLARGICPDAVIAANDYMALGAMDVLRAHGLKIPEQVRVIGFDDSPLAPVAPRSLTSVAQPAEAMATHAFEALLAQLDSTPNGGPSSEPKGGAGSGARPRSLAPELSLRDSCGCGGTEQLWSTAPGSPTLAVGPFALRSQATLRDAFLAGARNSTESWAASAQPLVDAMIQDLTGDSGHFRDVLRDVAERGTGGHAALDHLRRGLLAMKRTLDSRGYGTDLPHMEAIWLQSWHTLSAISSRDYGKDALDLFERFVQLRYAVQGLSLALEPASLAEELQAAFARIGVASGAVALLSHDRERLEPLLVLDRGRAVATDSYDRRLLLPPSLPCRAGASFAVMALSFEAEVTGIFIVEGSTAPVVAELLRSQIGSTIRVGALHHQVLEETTVRDRADEARLERELTIARRIQLDLAPGERRAEKLQVCTGFVPAKGAGADYHDVIVVDDGAWLALGEVTGHGLLAGLVVLMLQSMVSALTRTHAGKSPSEIVKALTRSLTDNLQGRLKIEDCATLILARIMSDGRVRWVGSTQNVLVWRHRTGTTEGLVGQVTQVGARAESESRKDSQLQLEPGDLLVVVSQGLVDACNTGAEAFGAHRLRQVLSAHASGGAVGVRNALMQAMSAWSTNPTADQTCLVALFEGAPGDAG